MATFHTRLETTLRLKIVSSIIGTLSNATSLKSNVHDAREEKQDGENRMVVLLIGWLKSPMAIHMMRTRKTVKNEPIRKC